MAWRVDFGGRRHKRGEAGFAGLFEGRPARDEGVGTCEGEKWLGAAVVKVRGPFATELGDPKN